MTGIFLLLLLAVPFVELWIILEVADGIGILATIVLMIFISIAGAWLLKQQGLATWKRVRSSLNRGEVPTSEVTDGALILFGGALLLTPGFLSDAVGLLFLLPPTRAALKSATGRLLTRLALRRWRRGPGGQVYEGRVIRTRRSDFPTGAPRTPSSEASSESLPSRRHTPEQEGSSGGE